MTHDPRHPTRRAVVQGALWSAPAIVVATAVPAYAASGDAAVITTIEPTSDRPNRELPVSITFTNRNTGSTGATAVTVTLTPGVGLGVVDLTPPAEVTPGWVAGTPSRAAIGNGAIFPFTSATGIPGAATAVGTATELLEFVVKVGPDAVLTSAGVIATMALPTRGDISDGTGTWT